MPLTLHFISTFSHFFKKIHLIIHYCTWVIYIHAIHFSRDSYMIHFHMGFWRVIFICDSCMIHFLRDSWKIHFSHVILIWFIFTYDSYMIHFHMWFLHDSFFTWFLKDSCFTCDSYMNHFHIWFLHDSFSTYDSHMIHLFSHVIFIQDSCIFFPTHITFLFFRYNFQFFFTWTNEVEWVHV